MSPPTLNIMDEKIQCRYNVSSKFLVDMNTIQHDYLRYDTI